MRLTLVLLLLLAATLFACGGEEPQEPAVEEIADPTGSASLFRILDSYHCSRYNTNTRRLTPEMFHDVFARARELLPQALDA